jgi:hypothetical protein
MAGCNADSNLRLWGLVVDGQTPADAVLVLTKPLITVKL